MQDNRYSQPFFNTLPPAVVALAAAIFAVELLLSLGARGIIGGCRRSRTSPSMLPSCHG